MGAAATVPLALPRHLCPPLPCGASTVLACWDWPFPGSGPLDPDLGGVFPCLSFPEVWTGLSDLQGLLGRPGWP